MGAGCSWTLHISVSGMPGGHWHTWWAPVLSVALSTKKVANKRTRSSQEEMKHSVYTPVYTGAFSIHHICFYWLKTWTGEKKWMFVFHISSSLRENTIRQNAGFNSSWLFMHESYIIEVWHKLFVTLQSAPTSVQGTEKEASFRKAGNLKKFFWEYISSSHLIFPLFMR